MIPYDEWSSDLLEWHEPFGPFISRSAAACPGPMNEQIAETWVRAAVAAKVPVGQASSLVVTGRWANTFVRRDLLKLRFDELRSKGGKRQLDQTDETHTFAGTPKVSFKDALRPVPRKSVPALTTADYCIRGLVDAWKTLARVPGHKTVGRRVAELLDQYFVANPLGGTAVG